MKIARFSYQDRELYGVVDGGQVNVIDGNIFGSYTITEESLPLTAVWPIGFSGTLVTKRASSP